MPQWTFQTGDLGEFETTPLLRDNVLYVTGPNNLAWAIDARTGRQIWRYRRELPSGLTACCGLVNRGFGMLGDKLYMATLDAHLIALDMKTGAVAWDATMEDFSSGYAATIAPIVAKNKVISAVAGGEYGIRGFIDAYDAATGKRAWRFYTVPAPGRAGQRHVGRRFVEGGRRWRLGDRRLRSGAEPALLRYRATPVPTTTARAARATTSTATHSSPSMPTRARCAGTTSSPRTICTTGTPPRSPILADLTIGGQPRKVVMFANRNGFFYTLDRTNGKMIMARPFVTTTWAKEIGRTGGRSFCPVTFPDEKGVAHVSRSDRRHQLLAARASIRARGSSS